MATHEKDALTGTETTGHEWDGIKELNTPLPRWWLWTFWGSVIWAMGYFIAYPAWPTLSGYTKGVLGYNSRLELGKELEAVKQSRSVWLDKFEKMSVAEVAADQELLTYAMAGGKVIFGDNCAPCHGASGSGNSGYPVLADDDWLWGGTVDDIAQTIRFGIRTDHADTRSNVMPPFVKDELITVEQADQIAGYVMSLSGQGTVPEGDTALFVEHCASCHGQDGKGLSDMGGPNLTDGIWLYGGSKEAVLSQIKAPKSGVMPVWTGRLSDVEIKQVSVYVHSLGGGK